MSKWLHRFLVVLGGASLVVSVIVPVAAPFLGAFGVKLTAIGAGSALLAANLRKARGEPPTPPPAVK